LENSDQQYGVKIIADACKTPCITICNNAGLSGILIANQLLEQNDEKLGVNANNGDKVNMISAGIIDPTRVVRTAIVGAVRVSSLMLTTEAMVVDEQKKEEKNNKAISMDDMEY
jgi:chaperonin GroEL